MTVITIQCRLVASATNYKAVWRLMAERICKSWLKSLQRLDFQLKAKRRWLNQLKTDEQLIEESHCCLEQIRIKRQ